jgi:hypothetical protein
MVEEKVLKMRETLIKHCLTEFRSSQDSLCLGAISAHVLEIMKLLYDVQFTEEWKEIIQAQNRKDSSSDNVEPSGQLELAYLFILFNSEHLARLFLSVHS